MPRRRGPARVSGAGRPARPSSTSSSASLLAHLRDRTLEVGPVVADGGRATLRPCARAGAPEASSGTSWKTPSRPSCSALIASQRSRTRAGRARLGVAEDVRVPAHELFVYGPGDLVEVPLALLLEEQREEEHLEEEVAELVEELRGIVRERGVGDLVRLLDRVRDDRASRLLAVPGALGPEAPGQLTELAERAVCAHAADVTRRSSSRRSWWTCPAARTRRRTGPCPCTPSRRPRPTC